MEPLIYNAIKLNVDATWNRGVSSIVVVARNHEGDVMRVGYDNYCCSSPFAAKLLTI